MDLHRALCISFLIFVHPIYPVIDMDYTISNKTGAAVTLALIAGREREIGYLTLLPGGTVVFSCPEKSVFVRIEKRDGQIATGTAIGGRPFTLLGKGGLRISVDMNN